MLSAIVLGLVSGLMTVSAIMLMAWVAIAVVMWCKRIQFWWVS